MKAKTINVQIVKNCGNYESIRIGGEWELNGESVEQATQAALAELNAAWELCKRPAPQVKTEQAAEQVAEQPKPAADGRQVVEFRKDNELLQKIVKRVQKTDVTMARLNELYAFDDDARKCVEAAIKLR
jgi:hypothetical protein